MGVRRVHSGASKGILRTAKAPPPPRYAYARRLKVSNAGGGARMRALPPWKTLVCFSGVLYVLPTFTVGGLVPMYMHTYVDVCPHIHTSYIHIHMCVCICVYIYVRKQVCICMYVCIRVYAVDSQHSEARSSSMGAACDIEAAADVTPKRCHSSWHSMRPDWVPPK